MPLRRERYENAVEYSTLTVEFQRSQRLANIILRGPNAATPVGAEAMVELGSEFWPLRLARELDDAILDIRANELDVAAIVFTSSGDPAQVLSCDRFLDPHAPHWPAAEVRNFCKPVFKP